MADMALSAVEFRVSVTDQGVAQVVPFIDGGSLLERVGDHERAQGHDLAGRYAGLVPAYFQFGDLSAYYRGEEGDQWPEPGKVSLLGCECGEVGCWPLDASVVAIEERVIWLDFAQPHRAEWTYVGFGPFVFDREQYDGAVAQAIVHLDDGAR